MVCVPSSQYLPTYDPALTADHRTGNHLHSHVSNFDVNKYFFFNFFILSIINS